MTPNKSLNRTIRLATRLCSGAVSAAIGASFAGGVSAADTTAFKATYTISIGTAIVGRASAEGRFTGDSYAATITGSTGGVSRLVSDANARLSGSGHLKGRTVVPSFFYLETVERGFGTHVEMSMERGRITNLIAVPSLSVASDRVPITPRHKKDIVDPLGAFLVPVDPPGNLSGRTVCNRKLEVFDGWTRFDVQLYYKTMKAVDGGSDTYAGPLVVCGARYIPVAGHRRNGDTLNDLVDNDRLEVWLAPVENTAVLVPFRIVIGTRWGDIAVHATRFSATVSKDRASLE